MTNIRYSYTFLNKFSIEATIPSTTDIVLRSRDSNQLVLMKEMQIEHEQYEDTIATLEYQKRLSHEQLLSLVDYHPQPDLNKIMVLYEYCTISLQEEFENRLSEQRYFEESELWSIFTSLAFGLAYLQEENVGHGSISLFDCFLNEQGFIKVSDPTCATSNPYTIVKGYYYSPEIMRCLINETGEELNIFKSDVFVLGCCMLKLTLMREIGCLFDYDNGLINKRNLTDLIDEIETFGLSREYLSFLNQILILDYHQRPDFINLKSQIFAVLSLDPNEQSEQLNSQSFDIKSSISSMQQSQNEDELTTFRPTIINEKSSSKTKYRKSENIEKINYERKPLREVSCGILNNNINDNLNSKIKSDFFNKEPETSNQILINIHEHQNFDFENPEKSSLSNSSYPILGKNSKLHLFKENKPEIELDIEKIGFGKVENKKTEETLTKPEIDLRLSFETSCSKNSKNSNQTNYSESIIPHTSTSKIETLKAQLDKIMINKPSPTMTPKNIKKETVHKENEDYSDPGFLKMMQEEMSCILNKRKYLS